MTGILGTGEEDYRKNTEFTKGHKGNLLLLPHPLPNFAHPAILRETESKHFKPSHGCQLVIFNK